MKDKKESLGGRSARTFSVLTLGRVLALFIGLISVIIIGRIMGPSAYGTYGIAFAFFSLIGSTNNFGYGSYLTKYLAQFQDKKDFDGMRRSLATGYISVSVIGLILTLLGIAVSGFTAAYFQLSNVTTLNLMLSSCILFFFMIYGTSDHALVGMGKNSAAILLENGENIVLLISSVALIELGYGVNGAIAGLLISYVFASLVGTYFVFKFAHALTQRRLEWPTLQEIKNAFKFSMPIAVNNFLNNGIVNFATLLLGLFVPVAELGNYAIASRARNVLSVFYGTTSVTLLPTLTIGITRQKSKSSARLPFIYNKALLYSMIATVPIITYLGVYSAPVIYLTVTQMFTTAPLYLSLISFGTIISLAGVYATSLFIAKEKTSYILVYSLLAAMMQLIALLVLTPLVGTLGTIFSIFFIGGAFSSYLFLRGTRKVLHVKTNYYKLVCLFISNVALAVVFATGLFISNVILQLAYGIVVFLVFYPMFLAAFKSVDKEDVELLYTSTARLGALRKILSPFISYLKILTFYLQ